MAHLSWQNIEPILHWLGLLSFCTFIISLALIPLLIGKIPEDYFVRRAISAKTWNWRSGFGRVLWLILRNITGGILLLAGVIMLFLPGQGILTIIVGFILMTFPGKQHLISSLTAQASVRRGLDWIRTKAGHRTFIWPNRNPDQPA